MFFRNQKDGHLGNLVRQGSRWERAPDSMRHSPHEPSVLPSAAPPWAQGKRWHAIHRWLRVSVRRQRIPTYALEGLMMCTANISIAQKSIDESLCRKAQKQNKKTKHNSINKTEGKGKAGGRKRENKWPKIRLLQWLFSIVETRFLGHAKEGTDRDPKTTKGKNTKNHMVSCILTACSPRLGWRARSRRRPCSASTTRTLRLRATVGSGLHWPQSSHHIPCERGWP